MRSSIYRFFFKVFDATLASFQVAGDLSLSVLHRLLTFAYDAIVALSRLVLWSIDREQFKHAEAVAEQENINTELEVILCVTKIKDDAVMAGKWSPHHTMALNELGQTLLDECEWEESKIHDYFRSIVENLGLTYLCNDEDNDEDQSLPINV